jgi:hypothetical protein
MGTDTTPDLAALGSDAPLEPCPVHWISQCGTCVYETYKHGTRWSTLPAVDVSPDEAEEWIRAVAAGGYPRMVHAWGAASQLVALLAGLRARVAELEADVRGTAAARDSWRAETLAHRAELEAGETRTEWGVRSGEYVDAHPTGQSARTEVRRYGGDLMRRQVGPWVPVEDETTAELAGRDG